MDRTKIRDIRKIIDANKNDIAFVIGNGINHHVKTGRTWDELLLKLWNDNLNGGKEIIPEGIAYTEFFDVLDINIKKSNIFRHEPKKVDLQMALKKELLKWNWDKTQNVMLNQIRKFDVPLLTTNFDENISKSMELKMQNNKGDSIYRWKEHFSAKELATPISGFGVWHINGIARYGRSLKLSLTQYMGNVAKARKLIHGNDEENLFVAKDRQIWGGKDTWLHIIFNRSLFIFGLGLEENEIFLRWLLIERAKYFLKFHDRKQIGWYLCNKNEDDKSQMGKKFFLESVGIQIIEVADYKTIYEDIWDY